MMALLAMPWSKASLRTVRREAAHASRAPMAAVIGIDDFAGRRDYGHGGIVVDLERCTVIDILPDRRMETVMAWLRDNEQVRTLCRAPGPGYGAAAGEAAPRARRVADRWHLFEKASAAFLAAVLSEMPPGCAKPSRLKNPWPGSNSKLMTLPRASVSSRVWGLPLWARSDLVLNTALAVCHRGSQLQGFSRATALRSPPAP